MSATELTGAELVAEAEWLPAKRMRALAGVAGENRLAIAGLVVIVLLTLFSFLGPVFYHTNQVATNLLLQNEKPSSTHLLGTSPQGRDEIGQLMAGGQSTLEVGFAVAVVATGFGMVWGAIAGFIGGILDAFMMRVVDAMLAIPFLFFIALLAAILTPNLFIIVFAISVSSWPATARLVRGEVLSLRTRDFVTASRGFGARPLYVIFRHLTPNTLGIVAVTATLQIADAILIYAGLAYLGLGLPPPATSWGNMLSDYIENNLYSGYWWQFWPSAICIVAIVLAVNVVGDGLHDMVESRLVRR
jgi:ABC-type dipeptide/oligopeptide/nickel transport system permease subunit